MKTKTKKFLKRFWHFIWEEDSAWSWIANITLAFVLIKFIVYPGLGLILGTTYPVVAVVSSSMEHNSIKTCVSANMLNEENRRCESYKSTMCGNIYNNSKFFDLDKYWNECGNWYEKAGISKEEFSKFPYKNGFNKGDIMVLKKAIPEKIAQGETIVFFSNRKDPIIHRVVSTKKNNGTIYLHTKGDNNEESITGNSLDETNIKEDAVIGKAVVRIPLLGYIKIWFVDIIKILGIYKQ